METTAVMSFPDPRRLAPTDELPSYLQALSVDLARCDQVCLPGLYEQRIFISWAKNPGTHWHELVLYVTDRSDYREEGKLVRSVNDVRLYRNLEDALTRYIHFHTSFSRLEDWLAELLTQGVGQQSEALLNEYRLLTGALEQELGVPYVIQVRSPGSLPIPEGDNSHANTR
jgi:hypothetical protein